MSPPNAHLCLSLTPNHPHRSLAAGRDLGIPAVTQELPPLLSAFFSSRSESRTSLGPSPSGRDGRLYGSHCFDTGGQLKHNISDWMAHRSLLCHMPYILSLTCPAALQSCRTAPRANLRPSPLLLPLLLTSKHPSPHTDTVSPAA